jgi:hypothetical protein
VFAFGDGPRKSEALLAAFGKTCSLQSQDSEFSRSIAELNNALGAIAKERGAQTTTECSAALRGINTSMQDVNEINAYYQSKSARASRAAGNDRLKEYIGALELEVAALAGKKAEADALLAKARADDPQFQAAESRKQAENAALYQAQIDSALEAMKKTRADYAARTVEGLSVTVSETRELEKLRASAVAKAAGISNALRSAVDFCAGQESRALLRTVPPLMGIVGSAAGLGELAASGLILAGSVVSNSIDYVANSKFTEQEVMAVLDQAARPEAISCTFERFTGIYCSNSTAIALRKKGLAGQDCRGCLSERVKKGFQLLGADQGRQLKKFVDDYAKKKNFGGDEFEPALKQVTVLKTYGEDSLLEVRRVLASRDDRARGLREKRARSGGLSDVEESELQDFSSVDQAYSNLEAIQGRIDDFWQRFRKFEEARREIRARDIAHKDRLLAYQANHVAFVQSLFESSYGPGSAGAENGMPDLSDDVASVVALDLRVQALESKRRIQSLDASSGAQAPARAAEERKLEALARYSAEWVARGAESSLGEGLASQNGVMLRGDSMPERSLANLQAVQSRVMQTLHKVGDYLKEDIEESLLKVDALRKNANLGEQERESLSTTRKTLCLNSLAILEIPEEIRNACAAEPPSNSLFNQRKDLDWGARACTLYNESLRQRAGY